MQPRDSGSTGDWGAVVSGDIIRRSETFALMRRFEESGALTSTSLDLSSRPDLTFAEFQAIGIFLARVHDGTKFFLADWILEGERRFGEEFAQAITATGRSERTLLNWVWVARSVAPSRRRESLTFSHHAVVAPLEPDEQAQWLEQAEVEGLSTRELETAVRDQRAIEPATTDDCPDLDEIADEVRGRLRACYGDVTVEIRSPGVSYLVGPR